MSAKLYRSTVSSQNKTIKLTDHSKENKKAWNFTTKVNVSPVNRTNSSSASKRNISKYRSNNSKMKIRNQNLEEKQQNERCPQSKEKANGQKDKTKAEIHKEVDQSISRQSQQQQQLLLPLKPMKATNNICLIDKANDKGGLKKLKAKIIGNSTTSPCNIMHSIVIHQKQRPISLIKNSQSINQVGKTSFLRVQEKLQF